MVAGQNPSLTREEISRCGQPLTNRWEHPCRASLPFGFTGNHDASAALAVSGKYLFSQERWLPRIGTILNTTQD